LTEVARLGLRWLVKKRSHHESLAQERAGFRAMERLIPRPPRDTRTLRVDAGGVPGDCIAVPASRGDRHVLYLHGGGYRVGSAAIYRHFTWRLAAAAQARLLIIDYRLAPENPFPAALDDAAAAYRWMLAKGADPRRLAVMGESAGGGLALALLLKLRDEGVPLAAACVAMSPWTDLALTGASLEQNAASDPMLNADDLPRFAADYLAGADPRNPYASPLYGDPAGLPPALIFAGSDEILRDDATRMAQKLRDAHSHVELQIWPRMPHAWPLLVPVLPAARAAIGEIGRFIGRTMTRERRPLHRTGPVSENGTLL